MSEDNRKNKISEKRLKRSEVATKEEQKPASFGYSVKLSGHESSKTSHPKQAQEAHLDPKNMSPEEKAKAKADLMKRLQSDPNARAQMQQMMKEQLKKLPLKQKITRLTLFFSIQKMQAAIVNALKTIDQFINFVVKKHGDDRNEVLQKARPPILFGMWIAIITFCIFGVWAGIAPLDSASSAVGMVVSDSNKKFIQHKEGGIVEDIYVKDGDHVKKGQSLIKLSDASLKPQLNSYLNREIHYRAWLDRLNAEKNHSNQIHFGDDLIANIQDPEVNKIIMNQQTQFESRRETLEGKLSGVDQKIEQSKQEIIAGEAQKASIKRQLELTKEQVQVLSDLYEKGLTQKPRLIEQQSREANLIASLSEIDSKIMRVKQSIAELKIEKENIRSSFQSEVNREIRDVSEKLNETQEQIKIIRDQFDRLVITSPIDGIVNKIQVHSVGAVINPSNPIMSIIPENDNLVIDAFVRPQDIDSVYVGLKAKVRISAFKSRSTGPLDGTVTYVSPDITEAPSLDQAQQAILQQQFMYNAYKVRIKVEKEQLKKISRYRDYELYPGMQADVMIVTGERTLLQYLLDPVTTTFWHAFTEK